MYVVSVTKGRLAEIIGPEESPSLPFRSRVKGRSDRARALAFRYRFLGRGLPYHENRMYLNEDVRDKWGQPTVTRLRLKENEYEMRRI